jgi:hypothetical protein
MEEKFESPEKNGLMIREWKWCGSKEQRTCNEVCANNLKMGKCLKTKNGCKVKPKPMAEEDKVRLRAYEKPRESLRVQGPLIECLRRIGPQKASILSRPLETLSKDHGDGWKFIPERKITQWIYRGKIPAKFIEQIEQMTRPVPV